MASSSISPLGPGGEIFGHDAAGNQPSRPAGVTVTYTSFERSGSLPSLQRRKGTK